MSMLMFMREAVISFRQLGTFLPTQSCLARNIARTLPHRDGMKIVELGAGEGSITRAIIHELGEIDYRFLVIEPNENLLTANQQSICLLAGLPEDQDYGDPVPAARGDSRRHLHFLPADAFALGRILDDRHISSVDAIVSSLPLFYFSPLQRRDLFALAKDRLAQEGIFIQYRYTPAGVGELQPFFSRIHRRFVPNFLPAWLFVCENTASSPGPSQLELATTSRAAIGFTSKGLRFFEDRFEGLRTVTSDLAQTSL